MAFTHASGQKNLTANNNNHSAQQALTPPSHPNDRAMSATLNGLGFNASHVAREEDDEEEDEDEISAPIQLTINTNLVIAGDNNVIAVDPSFTTQKVAMAIVTAIKQMSMGVSGVPMVDENGRPREVKITVFAETRIEGSKNIVGERAILGRIGQNGAAVAKMVEEEVESEPKIKREREENHAMENKVKRPRVE